jgi:tetratricopeptide (TPR) repeat protein
MRAVFDHSWRTLTEREREVFQGLSVFRGGFTREAAQAVSGASLHELMALVHKSLLHRTPTPSTPSTALRTGGRYEVHELLRQYAADKLRRADKLDQTPSEGQAVRDRHSAFYATALQEWEDDLKGPRQQTALAEMDAEIENARAAWDWAAEWGQVERLDQALEGLCLFYSRRMRFQEGEEMCRLAARKLETAAKGGELQLLVKLLAEQSYFNFELGHKEFTNQLLRKSLALLERPELAGQDTRWEKAYVLRRMAQASIPDFEKARRLYEQSLALYQALGDRWWTANALISLGSVVGYLDMYGKAQQLLEQSLEIRQALGDSLGIARSLLFLGVNALQQGQLERAERLAREGYAISQKAGDWAKNMSLSTLGQTLSWCGKFAEAQALLQENLTIWNDQGDRAMLAWSNTLLGSIEVLYLGRYEQARALIQKGIALARKVDAQVRVGVSLHWLGCVALAREKYAEAQQLFQESVVIYRELGLRADLGEALGGLGIALRGLGYLPQAEQHLSEALRTAVEIGAFRPLMYVIPAMALLLADAGGSARGEKEQAVELYALASRYRYVANSRWFEDVVGKHITAVAVNLPPEVVAAAQERGRARDLWATAAELLAELEREHTPPETT